MIASKGICLSFDKFVSHFRMFYECLLHKNNTEASEKKRWNQLYRIRFYFKSMIELHDFWKSNTNPTKNDDW